LPDTFEKLPEATFAYKNTIDIQNRKIKNSPSSTGFRR
jgi:hypothetical protein